MQKVNLAEKLALIADHWNPRIAGELNGQHVKLVKFKGEFVWHDHAHEDEMFLVLAGRFRMDFRDRSVELHAGEFLIVPPRRRAPPGGRGRGQRPAVRARWHRAYRRRRIGAHRPRLAAHLN